MGLLDGYKQKVPISVGIASWGAPSAIEVVQLLTRKLVLASAASLTAIRRWNSFDALGYGLGYGHVATVPIAPTTQAFVGASSTSPGRKKHAWERRILMLSLGQQRSWR
jgi:hypothetical protein